MARNVFISFLGASNYGECTYVRSPFKLESTRYIQVATLEYLEAKKWNSTDVALILLTDTAEKRNWVDNGHKDDDGNVIEQTGLKSELEKMHLPLELKPIKNLPNGNNEEEIWSIFTRLYGELEDGDELYFDLTHGFRYLPMLVLVMGNYAKFLKGATVKNITYGNYEGRNFETNEALIVNLMPLTALQDWTFAAADFIENGNGKRLSKMASDFAKPILKKTLGTDKAAKSLQCFAKSLPNVTEDFQTCRGINIINSTNISDIKCSLSQLETSLITPLNPVLERISNELSAFSNVEDIKNGFEAVNWCIKKGLYQQAATILQESIVSYICYRHNIPINSSKEREAVNNALHIIYYDKEEDESSWIIKEENIEKVKELIRDDFLKTDGLAGNFLSLANSIRNDINHAGMRENFMTSKRLEEKIIEIFNFFYTLIEKQS